MSKTYCAVKAIRKVLFLMLHGSADNVIREADVEPSRLIRHDVTPVVLHEGGIVSVLDTVTATDLLGLRAAAAEPVPHPARIRSAGFGMGSSGVGGIQN